MGFGPLSQQPVGAVQHVASRVKWLLRRPLLATYPPTRSARSICITCCPFPFPLTLFHCCCCCPLLLPPHRSYIIPQPVINHFITDYERNGQYTGFPTIRAEWQKLENPDLRKALKMKVGLGGGEDRLGLGSRLGLVAGMLVLAAPGCAYQCTDVIVMWVCLVWATTVLLPCHMSYVGNVRKARRHPECS